jgi:hypothetical protein
MLTLKSFLLTHAYRVAMQENGPHGYVKFVRQNYLMKKRNTMKGHDGLCPTPNPHLIDRQHCAYCNLIERVKEHFKSKGKTEHKTYEDGYQDGLAAAISTLQQAAG